MKTTTNFIVSEEKEEEERNGNFRIINNIIVRIYNFYS